MAKPTKASYLCEDLLVARVSAVVAGLFLLGVEIVETGLDLDAGVM